MGRLVKTTPAAQEQQEEKRTVVGTGAHGRLVKTGDVQRTSPAANTAKTPTAQSVYQKALDEAMMKRAAADQKNKERGRKRYNRTHAQEVREITGDKTKKSITPIIKSAAAGYAADMVGAADTLLRAPSGLNYAASQERGEIESSKKNIAAYSERLKAAKTEEERQRWQTLIDRNKRLIEINSKAAGERVKNYQDATKGAQETLQGAYQKLRKTASDNMEKANEGLTPVGKHLNNVGVAGAQMVADTVLGGGSALGPMFLRVFGGNSQEAMETADKPGMSSAEHLDAQNRALLYGTASGAVSIATEKISNVAAPFKKAFGGGFLDKAIDGAIAKMNGNAAGRLALSFLSEGGEEVIEDLVQPALQTIYNGKRAGQNYSELDAAEILNDFLVGGALGLLGSGVEGVQRRSAQIEAERAAAETKEATPSAEAMTPEEAAPTAQRPVQQQNTMPAQPAVTPESAQGTGGGNLTPTQPNAAQGATEGKADALDEGKRVALDKYTTQENVQQVSQKINDGTLAVDAEHNIYRVNEDQHIDRRDSASVGERSVNAFQFDHPELHSYYADAAAVLQEEMSFAQKGGELIRRTSREAGDDEYIRTKRGVSERITRLLDDEGVRYDDIDRSLSAIIHNHGQENFAEAKRVELLLDDMLTNGYTDIHGQHIAPNEEYIAAKKAIPGADMSERTHEELPIYDMPEGRNGGIDNAGQETRNHVGGAEFANTAKRGTPEAADAASALPDGAAERGERERGGRESGRIPREVRNVGGEDGNALTVQKRLEASGISQFISPREANVPNGASGSNTVTIFDEADWDQELIGAADWAKSKGVKKVTALLGVIKVEKDGKTGRIFGAFNADTGEIFVNAGSVQRSVSETIEHETAHYLAEVARRENVRTFMRDVQSRYSSEEWGKVYDAYFDRYAALTGDYAGMSESDIELYVWEEIMGDAYAEIDQYDEKASRFNREAESALSQSGQESESVLQSERTPGAVEQGRETAAATERRTGPPEKFSVLEEVEGENGTYGKGVMLDTNLFDGIRPRDWGKALSQYVYNNMAGMELTAYDAAGRPETVYLARTNDRVQKDGTKNSRKVIDKLARSTGDNIRSLAVVHLDEALTTSRYENSTDEHNHQWMDENGWEYRKTYLQDRSGNIYEATLNIADGRDRKILYDINNIRLVDKAKSPGERTAAGDSQRSRYQEPTAGDTQSEAKAGEITGGVVPSAVTGGARSTSRNFSEKRIADESENVKSPTLGDEIRRQIMGEETEPFKTGESSAKDVDTGGAASSAESVSENGGNVKLEGRFSAGDDAALQRRRDRADAELDRTVDEDDLAAQNDAADRAERLRVKSRDEFKGTKALDELGVKIANSAGIYHNAEQLIANDKAAKSIQNATKRAEQRLGATRQEKTIARDIANGERSMADIPRSVKKSRVLELVDYYTAQKATKTGLLQQQRIEINDALREQARELIGTEAPEINRKGLNKLFDPSKGLVLYHRTPQRIMRALFGWKQGQQINEAVFEPVYENEQERKRFINRMFDEVRTFEGADGKKSALNKDESAFAQRLKEGRTVEELVEKSGAAESIRAAAENLKNGAEMKDAAREFSLDEGSRDLARQYADWLQTQDDYAAAKNVDRTKVENAIEKYTELYDKLYAAINDFLVAHGYEPIGFIKGYAPHFQAKETNDKLENALKAIGVDLGSGVGKLPTSIAGLTKSFKPNKRYNPFFQHRRGDETDYDIVKGFETYVDYASDVLYHTDDIMRVRQMANYLRSTFAPEEMKADIDQMEAMRHAPADVKEEYLRDKKKITGDTFLSYEDLTNLMEQYTDEKYRSIEDATEFSDLVSWMDDYANKLAGKQLFEDRAMEREVGREALNGAKKLNRMFARANVAGNLSSALNQTAQLPMIATELGQKYTWRAVGDILNGKTTGMSAFRGESDFLTEKSGIDYIQSTKGEKAIEKLFSPLEKVDTLVSTIAVRGKYRMELDAGKSPKEAMKAADRWARDIMGTRSKGSVPLTFQSKNLIAQMLNMFQVEAANTLEHVTQDRLGPGFKEMAAKIGKDKAIKKLASDAIAYMLLAFLLNRLDEDAYGGTPAPFDVIGMGLNAVASGNGLTSSDMLKMITDDVTENIFGERLFDTDPNDMNDEFDGWSAAEDTLYNISNDVPYVRNVAGLMGWGDQTLPMPDIVGAAGKTKDALKNADSAGEFWAEVAKQLVGLAGDTLPGGRQAEKTAQGIEAVARGGSYKGSGDKKQLQYPVNSPLEDPFEALRAALFGKNALNESRVYWAEGGKALSASQTALYQELVDSGMSRKKAYETIRDFNDATADLEADKDENGNPVSGSKKEKVVEAINKLPLSRKQKNKLYLSKNYSEKDLGEMPWN